jgi:acetyl-CoA decarbonylase/synthase complex subunit gamma
VAVGEEEVMFRHEKAFFHEPGIAVLISDKETDADIDGKIGEVRELRFERIGRTLKIDMLALRFASGDPSRYKALVKRASDESGLPLILISEDTDVLLSGAALCSDRRPLVYPVTAENADRAIPRLRELKIPVGVKGGTIEEVAALTEKLIAAGIDEIVLDAGARDLVQAVRDQTLVRRSALKKGFRPLGYPTMALPCLMHRDPYLEMLTAAALVTKYAGIVVISQTSKALLLPLLVLRFNIYTDPRRPMTVEEKVYEISGPNETSPILITTNYALDFFVVSGAIEESGIPTYLCVKDTGGIGVLAAWTSGKFNGEAIADFIARHDMKSRVRHRKLIIPGVAKKLKEELEEELPEWEIVLGPMEAGDIPRFLSEKWGV